MSMLVGVVLANGTEGISRSRTISSSLGSRANAHLGHGTHVCHLVEWEGIDIKDYKPLVRNAKFVCKKCGRVAAKAENLCEPIEL